MNPQNFNKLKQLRLSGMAEAYESLFSNPNFKEFTFDELLTIMIDHEDSLRKSNKQARLIAQAKFTIKASIEGIHYDSDRKLDKKLIMKLATGDYILNGQNVVFKGVSGAGKTWLATALGIQACRRFYTVNYVRLPNLIEELKMAKHLSDGSFLKLIKKLVKVDLIIFDEWLLYNLTNEESALLLELTHAREEALKSNIYCSQFDFQGWYDKLGDGTLSEAILDRIIHNSYDIFIDSEVSMREKLGLKQTN